MSRKSWWILSTIIAGILLIMAGASWLTADRFTSSLSLLNKVRRALALNEYAQAETWARQLAARPGYADVGNLLAGQAAEKLGHTTEAVRYFDAIPADESPSSRESLLAAGDLLLETMLRLSDAERTYRRLFVQAPRDLAVHYRLAYVLGLQGRSWEAAPHRLALIRGQQAEPVQLVLLALGETAEENFHLVGDYARSNPNDPRVLCTQAWIHFRRDEVATARRLLEAGLAEEPGLMTAQAWLGRILLQQSTDDFLIWHNHLPPEADRHPDIWYARGLWAHAQGDVPGAIRCQWEAVKLDPEHTSALFQLGTLLTTTGKSEAAQPFLRRSKVLGDLTIAAKSYQLANGRPALEACARLSEESGLLWEAWGWNQILIQRFGSSPQLTRKSEQLRQRLQAFDTSAPVPARSERGFHPAEDVDLSHYPLPNWTEAAPSRNDPQTAGNGHDSSPQFLDLAEHAGITFQFRNGRAGRTVGEYMYEISGGGVGVIDFDGDNHPDLYLTQGCDWPPQPEQREHLDRLYRNLEGEKFVDVTEYARLQENGFSQGPAVGDIDQDGFPDIYVSNIGGNRLYLNNGDGTFTDVTAESATTGLDRWTVSSLIADLNGDGLPDIYAVNYLNEDDLFKRPCLQSGTARTCSPHEFAAAADQYFENLGDGRFADRTSAAGFTAENGKGLGIVAADFNDSGRLSLFVANDAVPNFCYVNESPPKSTQAEFKERGFLSGLAVAADGRAQACMGVAAGDANGDGLLDLFTTNFRNEPNTLYLNQSNATFVDETRRAGIHEPSFAMLGFGTQFIDAELDGWPDLVVANGHVGDLSQTGLAYEMPPQYFRNRGEARFEELPAASLGPYFQTPRLGRGLARLDWNGDGREDFAVNHINSPAALVTNQTQATGHFLAVKLRGVRCERDAIGAQVRITAGRQTWTQQLTAGDGYQASNQRQLLFGIGGARQVDRLEIHWPGGQLESLGPLSADRTYLIIQDQHQALPLGTTPTR